MVMSVRDFLFYISVEKRFSPHTIAAYERDLVQFDKFLSSRQILWESDNRVLVRCIRDWVVEMMSISTSPLTIRRKLSSLSSYFRFRIKRGLTLQNPVLGISMPKKQIKLPDYVRVNHLNQVIDNTSDDSSFEQENARLIILLLYHLGVRRSELISLNWKEVDFQSSQIRVFGKGNKVRILPMSPEIKAALQRYENMVKATLKDINNIGRVLITARGNPLYPSYVYRVVRKELGSVAPNVKLSPHTLRHSFATHLMDGGAELNAVKELLGHSSLAATQVYTHTSMQQLKDIYATAHPKSRKK
jgi:integrase/recombinase XerC